MKVFVPITDEMLENMSPTDSPVPYQVGLPLQPIIIDQKDWIPAVTDLADKLPADHPPPGPVHRQGRR